MHGNKQDPEIAQRQARALSCCSRGRRLASRKVPLPSETMFRPDAGAPLGSRDRHEPWSIRVGAHGVISSLDSLPPYGQPGQPAQPHSRPLSVHRPVSQFLRRAPCWLVRTRKLRHRCRNPPGLQFDRPLPISTGAQSSCTFAIQYGQSREGRKDWGVRAARAGFHAGRPWDCIGFQVE